MWIQSLHLFFSRWVLQSIPCLWPCVETSVWNQLPRPGTESSLRRCLLARSISSNRPPGALEQIGDIDFQKGINWLTQEKNGSCRATKTRPIKTGDTRNCLHLHRYFAFISWVEVEASVWKATSNDKKASRYVEPHCPMVWWCFKRHPFYPFLGSHLDMSICRNQSWRQVNTKGASNWFRKRWKRLALHSSAIIFHITTHGRFFIASQSRSKHV